MPRKSKAQLAAEQAAADARADQAAAQAKFVMDLPSAYVACRQQHQPAPIAPTRNGRLPKGVMAIGPYRDGSYDVLRTCGSCGMVLAYHTDTEGRIISWKPRRKYPKGFLAHGIGRISRILAYDEGYDRVSGDLLAGAIAPLAGE